MNTYFRLVMFPDIMHMKINNDRRWAILNFELQFFRVNPSIKSHIFL